jgi:hypothetical protein
MNWKRGLIGLLAAGAFASSCAGPRVVQSMGTTRDGKFRLLYGRNLGMGNGTEQGIIDCQAQADGTITNCQPVKLVFQEDK